MGPLRALVLVQMLIWISAHNSFKTKIKTWIVSQMRLAEAMFGRHWQACTHS